VDSEERGIESSRKERGNVVAMNGGEKGRRRRTICVSCAVESRTSFPIPIVSYTQRSAATQTQRPRNCMSTQPTPYTIKPLTHILQQPYFRAQHIDRFVVLPLQVVHVSAVLELGIGVRVGVRAVGVGAAAAPEGRRASAPWGWGVTEELGAVADPDSSSACVEMQSDTLGGWEVTGCRCVPL
jgi:hypothetical protein